MKTILVIDDDVSIGNLMQEALEQAGYLVRRAYSGTEAALLLAQQTPDLAILDLMLPGMTGEELLPRLRGVPVMVVSAKADLEDRVALLQEGAADYLVKPFALRELLARVEARLRETVNPAGRVLRYGGIELNTDTREASFQGTPVHLTRTEYAILKLLLQNPGQVLPKGRLLDRISLDTPDCTESSLKTHVSNLRRKLKEAGAGDRVEAVWGIGFRLRES